MCPLYEFLFLPLCKGEENIDVHMERLTIQALELVRCKYLIILNQAKLKMFLNSGSP